MLNTSVVCQIPLNVLLQSVENLIKHNEIESSRVLLQAITTSHPQYTQYLACLDSAGNLESPQSKHYIDIDYHTGLFEVFKTDNDESTALFESRKEAEEYVIRYG